MNLDLFRSNNVIPLSHAVLISTLAGNGAAASSNGVGSNASLNFPVGVAISRSRTFAVATERSGHRVRIIDLITSQVTTLAGSGNNSFADGQGTLASFSAPEGVAISLDGSFVIVAEGALTSSHRVRHIVIATGVVTTLAGNGAGSADGVGTLATFNGPRSIALSPDETYALIVDYHNFRVRRIDLASKAVSTVAGSIQGFADDTGTKAKFSANMFQIAIDPTGSYALICDVGNNRIRRLDIASSQVTTLAGSSAGGFQDGMGTNAIFNWPHGVSIDPTGRYVLIADHFGRRIRRIVIASAQVTTLAGTGAASAVDGVGAEATFSSPSEINIDISGSFALVADSGSNRIRRIALSSPPCSAGFYCPAGSSSPTQASCGAGQFCGITGLSAPTLCALGSYCSSPLTQIACPAGSSCNVTGLTDVAAATSCLPLTFSLAGSSACASCEANAYSLGGASTCVSCGACAGTSRAHRTVLSNVSGPSVSVCVSAC
jgi:DNA-binding beta-propeller fold protein YncE